MQLAHYNSDPNPEVLKGMQILVKAGCLGRGAAPDAEGYIHFCNTFMAVLA